MSTPTFLAILTCVFVTASAARMIGTARASRRHREEMRR